MVGADSFYYLGGILRAGKRGYALVHEPSVLRKFGIFNVCIGNDKEASKLFQQFEANHYDLRSDAIIGLGADLEWRLISFGAPYMNRYGASFKFSDDEVIKSPSCLYGHYYTVDFEELNSMASLNIPNLPEEILCKIIEMVGADSFYYLGGILRAGKRGYALVHEPSVLRKFGIFNVCIGNDKEASKLFQQFEANHYDLRSDAIVGLGADLEWRLISFGAPYMNRYGASFKFPDDEVIKSPSCLYGHDYTVDFAGSCKNCRLFWICCNISHIL
ncbi:hypothetical protein F2Q70_00022923 [Brassica cretica]|uniref:F-box domain-containing protein n=1 Tax=Brassica cretica TaxID=69181 RepID=A0A8S9GHK6_BRACR|nr:hypothetical protein F2Q70_00022923 [Brassica cretica]